MEQQTAAYSGSLNHRSRVYGLSSGIREALWLKKLLGDCGIKVGAMPIYTDSQGALKLLKHPIA